MESLLWLLREKDFVRSFREGSKVLIVRRGGNAVGRFLEMTVYVVGGRRGIIFIPKGRDGRGWSRFILELGKVRDFLKAPAGQGLVRPVPLLEKPQKDCDEANSGISTSSHPKDSAPSYMEVLHTSLSRPKKEKQLPRLVVPLGKDHCDRSKEGKKQFQSAPLVKLLQDFSL